MHGQARYQQAYCSSVQCPKTGNALEYKHLLQTKDAEVWQQSYANELARLANGLPQCNIQGTNTISFIPHTQVPPNKRVTYGRLVVNLKPHKTETHRTRLTVGGNLLQYANVKRTPTEDLSTIKILFNSVVSTPGDRFLTTDIKNFYLNTELPTPEYMKLQAKHIPSIITKHYNLAPIFHNEFLYLNIDKGMYGLKQAGILGWQDLKTHLAKYQFFPVRHTPGLWTQKTIPITFVLVVDEFGVKYHSQEAIEFLLSALQAKYQITTDYTGSLYCGITLNWNHSHHSVNLSMPNYIHQVLTQYKHPCPTKPVHAPSQWIEPSYGKTTQLAPLPDTSDQLDEKQQLLIQQITGSLLYYARAVDPTMLVAIEDIAAAQNKGTLNTMKAVTNMLNYAATHPNATTQFNRSDMILHAHSDASCLSAPKARIRAGGFYYLANTNLENHKINGPIHVEVKIMKNEVTSVAEAELSALFINTQHVIPLRTTLIEM